MMKNGPFYWGIIGSMALQSCAGGGEPQEPRSQEGWSKTIMYNVDKNTAYFDDLEDEDFAEFTTMGEQLIQDVLDGKRVAYDAFDIDKELTLQEVQAELFSMDTLFIENPETYEHEPVVVDNDFTKGIVAFKFKEKWKYNPTTGMIDKTVIAVAPKKAVLSPTSGEVRGFTSLFWIKLE